MGFRCQKCGEIGHKPVRVVVETGPIEHAARYRMTDCVDGGGRGTRVVREELRHPECAAVEVAAAKPTAELGNRPRLVVDNEKE